MKEVSYKRISSEEAYRLVVENDKRRDLFFEEDLIFEPDTLKNLYAHEIDVSKIHKVTWFLRVVKKEN